MPSNIDVVPAPPEQRHSRLPYLPGLDGLRALAVIAVLLFHAGVEVPGGFLGVESFFVLSGFLITGLLLAEWRTNGRVSLRAFWLRRARRLLPALVLVLAVTLLYTVAFLPRELAEVRSHVLSALLYVLNWQMVWSQQPYFDPTVRPPLLQHLWSLAVEEQFYLIWPLLFVGVMRSVRATGLLLLTLAGAAASAILMAVLVDPGGDPSRVYYGTDTRAAGLLLGAALAVVWQPGQPPAATRRDVGSLLEIAGVLALGTLMVVYRLLSEQQGLLYPWGFLLVDLSTALVIMAVTHPQARMVPRLLAWQPLRWIGLRSYGIYLWHWPIFQITRPYLDVPLQGWPLLVLRLALVVGVAALSYRWVELPVRQGAIPRSWRPPWKWGTTASAFGSLQALGGKRLRVPLAGLLVLVSVIWLARMATPRTAGGVAVLAPPTATTPAEGASRSSTALGTPTRGAGVSGAPTALSTPLPLDVPAAGGADRPELVATPAGNSTAPSPTVAPPPSDPVPLDPALAAELQRLLDETVADGFVPGAVLSISIPGYLPWSGASGIADRRLEVEMEPGTLVHLASLTKMFTAVVVLQLAEEGRIDLDAPIGTWLPEIVPLADRTTARHLLCHTSGVFDYLEDRRFFA